MTAPTDILAELVGILREHLHVHGPLSTGTSILDDLQLDSLQAMTFVVEVEDRYRICFAPEDQASIETLGDMAEHVWLRLQPQHKTAELSEQAQYREPQ